jgi:hypothetical protein
MNDDEMKGVSEKDKDVKSEIEMRNRKENWKLLWKESFWEFTLRV